MGLIGDDADEEAHRWLGPRGAAPGGGELGLQHTSIDCSPSLPPHSAEPFDPPPCAPLLHLPANSLCTIRDGWMDGLVEVAPPPRGGQTSSQRRRCCCCCRMIDDPYPLVRRWTEKPSRTHIYVSSPARPPALRPSLAAGLLPPPRWPGGWLVGWVVGGWSQQHFLASAFLASVTFWPPVARGPPSTSIRFFTCTHPASTQA